MSDRYEDIIHHTHHISTKHPPMSMRNRAAQFAPFAAVVGHTQALDETARLTEEEITLDIEKIEQINETLRLVEARLSVGEHPSCRLVYFLPDERKSGGSYQELFGKVRKIDRGHQLLCLENGREILLEALKEMIVE